MHYSKVERLNCYFTWIVLLINPLLSIPMILAGLYNKSKYAIIQLIFIFCLFAFLLPPSGDLFRFYDLFYLNYKGLNYIDIFDFYFFDFGWHSILYLLANLSVPYQYSQVISCIIQFGITYYILSYYVKSRQYKNISYFYVILGSFIYNGFWTPIEMRFYVGLAFYVLAVFYFDKGKYLLMTMCLLFASITHFSFLFFSFLLLATILIRRLLSLYVCIGLGLFASIVVVAIGQYMETIGFSKAVYIVDQTDWTAEGSFLLQITRQWIVYIPIVFFLIFLLYNRVNNFYYRLCGVYLSLFLATISLPDLNGRIKAITMVVLWLYFISCPIYLKSVSVKLFFYFSFFAFAVNTMLFNRSIQLGNFEDLVSPVPCILYNNVYNTNWVYRHIDDGNVFDIGD